MSDAQKIFNIIVGTAGHIDHGKSSLVQRLTGIDPDRLEEEKARGMTIDLGFAPYVDRQGRFVGLIDVPGHERFIKNMVAGATSVDIMLLVVAADDGVMPQTREHLQIMDLLGIQKGFVVVTKIDTVDPDLLELCIDDIQQFVEGTFLEGTPICQVSSITGEGFEPFVDTLEEYIASTPSRSVDGLFRLPVQRVFSAKGHGTVVTGVPISGEVKIGDVLEVQPGGQKGKVRGIQAYKRQWESARAGHSSALNLSDIDYREVERGQVVGTPGFFAAHQYFELRLRYLATADRPLRAREPVRFHVGTSEVMGSLTLLESPTLEPGGQALAQIHLEEPVVAVPGDRFLIRRPSPMVSLGGGTVLGASVGRLKRLKPDVIESVRERETALEDPRSAVAVAIKRAEGKPLQIKSVAVETQLPPDVVQREVDALIASGEAFTTEKGGGVVHAECFKAASKTVMKAVRAFHKKYPLRKWMEIALLRQATEMEEDLLTFVLSRGQREGKLAQDRGGKLRAADFKPALSEKQEAQLDVLRAAYATADLSPPSLNAAADTANMPPDDVEILVKLLVDEGELLRIGEHHFHRTAVDRAREALINQGREKPGQEIVIPELRDQLGTSRKYMIPLLEYFDSQAITVRRGDKRYLRSS